MIRLITARRRETTMPRMVVGGVTVKEDDVLVVVHEEQGGARQPWSSRCNRGAQSEIEMSFKNYSNVLFKAKDMHNLQDYFGDKWTEDAQYKITRAKKWYAHVLAYKGNLQDALIHVNQYLGGSITFISDDFERFVGSHVGAAVTRESRLAGHSGRCFVVKLAMFSPKQDVDEAEGAAYLDRGFY